MSRDYENTTRQEIVKKFYLGNHTKQTVEFVSEIKKQYEKINKTKMSIWDAVLKLGEIIDDSDPDLNLPQYIHCFQTAEMIRKQYPDSNWFQLVGLIHDCGKILMHPDIYNFPDYLVVGDTFPLGCKYSDQIVYPEYFVNNPDYKNELYQTKYGIYYKNIGFDNVIMSWGHDEYFYQVCIQNKCKLPPEALYIIRYHSFYSQHQNNAYDHLSNNYDEYMMEYVKEFQKFDLYSKDNNKNFEITKDIEDYYKNLISIYFPSECVF